VSTNLITHWNKTYAPRFEVNCRSGDSCAACRLAERNDRV